MNFDLTLILVGVGGVRAADLDGFGFIADADGEARPLEVAGYVRRTSGSETRIRTIPQRSFSPGAPGEGRRGLGRTAGGRPPKEDDALHPRRPTAHGIQATK
jgi:hypothetical protein